MSSQHRKQSTSLNFGRHFVIKFSIRFKGEVHLENLGYFHGLSWTCPFLGGKKPQPLKEAYVT